MMKNKQSLMPFIVIYYITIALYLLTSLYPEQRLWGVNAFYYLSIWEKISLLTFVLLVPVSFKFIDFEKISEGLNRISWSVYSCLLIPYMLLIFYLFSAKTYFLGDGYLLISRLETGSAPIRPWNKATYLLQDSIFALLGGKGEHLAILTFQIISYLSGLIFLLVVFWVATRLYKDNLQRMLFVLLLSSGGYMLLYFGYAENYPFLVTLVSIIGLFGLLIARDKLNRFWLLLPLCTAAFFHPFSIAMLPGVGYLLLKNTKFNSLWVSLRYPLKLTLIIAVSITGFITITYFYSVSNFFRFSLLQFSMNQFVVEGYWLFSWKHLIDYANLLLLLIPAFPIVILLAFKMSLLKLLKRTDFRFLLLLAVPSLLIIFIFDPKLGMARDWDLFSFAAIPLVLIIILSLEHFEINSTGKYKIIILIVLLNIFVLIPRVITQTMPDKSIEMIDNYASFDRLKNRVGTVLIQKYLEKRNRYSEVSARRVKHKKQYPEEDWLNEGRILVNEGRHTVAVERFKRVIKSDPTFYSAWSKIGIVFARQKQFDSALYYMKISDAMNPYNADNWTNIGGVYMEMGDEVEAAKYWKGATKLQKNHLLSRLYLLGYYKTANRIEDYNKIRSELVILNDVPLSLIQEEVEYLLKSGDISAAQKLLQRCISKGMTREYVSKLLQKYPELKNVKFSNPNQLNKE